IEQCCDPCARKRGVDLDGRALPSEVIHDVERSIPAPRSQSIRDEVHGPALVGPRRKRQSSSQRSGDALASLCPDGKPFGSIQSMNALVVHLEALSLKQEVQPAITKPRTTRCQRSQALEQLQRDLATGLILTARACKAQRPACSPLAHREV